MLIEPKREETVDPYSYTEGEDMICSAVKAVAAKAG